MAYNKIIIEKLSKYLWYDKEYAMAHEPEKILAHAMRYCTIEDLPLLLSLGNETLKNILDNACPGWFDEKNWTFWHVILGVPKRPLKKRLVP